MRWFAVLLVFLVACTQAETQRQREVQRKYKYNLDIATSYVGSGDFKKALIYAFKAERLKKTPEVYNVEGLAYLGLAEYDKALAAFERAVKLDPNYSEAWANMAAVYLQRGKLDRAVEVSKRALSNRFFMHPEVAYTNMAEAYFRMGKEKKALECLDKALRYNIYYAPAYEKLVGYYMAKGEYSKVRGVLEDARAAGVVSPGLTFFRALLLIRDGDVETAERLLRAILRDNPFSPWAKQARQYLESLR